MKMISTPDRDAPHALRAHLFAQHEGVLDALTFGAPDDRLGESLHLMAVARDRSLSERDLREWKNRLERFNTPDFLLFVDALPAGRTGKMDRAAARMFPSGASGQASIAATRGANGVWKHTPHRG
jgi:acyl-CoA synthetase (AMP-forming)/AMP-acid ligase II